MIHSGLAGIKKELRQVYLAELVHAPIRHKIESLRQAGVTFPLIMKVMDPFREKVSMDRGGHPQAGSTTGNA